MESISPFATKSDNNWALAEECLQSGEINAAANRFYYALFQGLKAYGVACGKVEMDDNCNAHMKVGDLLKEPRWRLWHNQFKRLKEFRVTADYFLDDVKKHELEELLPESNNMRQHFLNKALKQSK